MFSVGTNFDQELISLIKDENVYEVYGKFPTDVIGGNRPSSVLKPIKKRDLEQTVNAAHVSGIEFNYLLNANTLSNIEYTKKGHRKIYQLLDFLRNIKVDSVTVTVPYLAKLILKNFPSFKVKVSTLAGIDNLKKFCLWQEMGVDSIVLDISANRNFHLLQQLQKIRKCNIPLMVNEGCENNCLYRDYHAAINTSQTQKRNQLGVHYCGYHCRLRRTEEPYLLLSAPWIRPEDLKVYRQLGYDQFKIVNRQDPTERIVRAVKAYNRESYIGNLVDIVSFIYNIKRKEDEHSALNFRKMIHHLRYSFKPLSINLKRAFEVSQLVDDHYDLFIDNQQLDGFLQYFIAGKCFDYACSDCDYCKKWAEKVLTFSNSKRWKVIKNFKKIDDAFLVRDKSLFR